MAITVTCGNDVELGYSASERTVQLNASANVSGAVFAWNLISVPSGSNALSQTRGSFVNGACVGSSPIFITEAGREGTYVFQCTTDFSVPGVDRQLAQQCIVITTQNLGLILPGDYQYNWGEYNTRSLLAVAAGFPLTLAELNNQITDATLDKDTDSRGSSTHALDSVYHTGTMTLAQLNSMISDADVDDASSGRGSVSGAASGDLSGTYPNPTVAGLGGDVLDLSGASASDLCIKTGSTATWEATTFTTPTTLLGLTDTPSSYTTASGQILVVDERTSPTVVHQPITGICRQNFPVFNCTDQITVNGYSGQGASSIMSLVLSDGKMYTATSPLTCSLQSTGLDGRVTADALAYHHWHIFAVNDPSNPGKFRLILKYNNDPSANFSLDWLAAEGLTAAKYLNSVKCHNNINGYIFQFQQTGKWNQFTNLYSLGYPWSMRLVYMSAASGMTQNVWRECANDEPPHTGGTTDSYPLNWMVPPGICSAVEIKGGADLDYNESWLVDLMAGTKAQCDAVAGGAGTAACYWMATNSLGTYDTRIVVSDIFPITDDAIMCYMFHSDYGSGPIEMSINVVAWCNQYYGDSYSEDYQVI